MLHRAVGLQGNPVAFSTWLASRPRRFEKNAIRALINVLKEGEAGGTACMVACPAEGGPNRLFQCSSSSSALCIYLAGHRALLCST